MKHTFLILIAVLFLSGCPKRVEPRYPVVTTQPPKYIWVCKQLVGFQRCDAVASKKDVPSGYDCVTQSDGMEVCWENKMTHPREQK